MTPYFVVDWIAIARRPEILFGAEKRGIFILPDAAWPLIRSADQSRTLPPHVWRQFLDLVKRGRIELLKTGFCDPARPEELREGVREIPAADLLLKTALRARQLGRQPLVVVTDN